MGLGSLLSFSLSDARTRAASFRGMASEGTGPIAEPKQIPNFTTCAARYIRAHRQSCKSAKQEKQRVSTLKVYAKPIIGTQRVETILTQDVLKILCPIWTTKTKTAKRMQGRIENILDFAAAHKHRDSLNPARWRGHLDKLLPGTSRVRSVNHYPAMPYTDVPGFMSEVRANNSVSAFALQFLILTATRTSEVLVADGPRSTRRQKYGRYSSTHESPKRAQGSSVGSGY